MENQKTGAMTRFGVILLAVSVMLLFASPCAALDVPLSSGQTTLNVDYPINDSVVIEAGGTLNLLDGGSINGAFGIGIENGGILNIYGGYISSDVYIASGSEVNIKGGSIRGNVFGWDITVESQAAVTVFGTDFGVTNGVLDPSGTYFTPYTWPPCLLTGQYGAGAGDIDLMFYVFSQGVHIFLSPPESETKAIELMIDIKPGDEQNNINLRSNGVVPVAVIKPGDEQNNINLRSNGVVPVAVLTSEQFDAASVDPATAVFAGAASVQWSLEDVDGDGDVDAIFHFRTQELDLNEQSQQATLTAQLKSQMAIRSTAQVSGGSVLSGTDTVQIVSAKKSKK